MSSAGRTGIWRIRKNILEVESAGLAISKHCPSFFLSEERRGSSTSGSTASDPPQRSKVHLGNRQGKLAQSMLEGPKANIPTGSMEKETTVAAGPAVSTLTSAHRGMGGL